MNPLHRILIVDDNAAVHRDYYEVLGQPTVDSNAEFEELDELVLGGAGPARAPTSYRLESVYQGSQALEAVIKARDASDPFAVVFMDARMPPGWDGIETARRIWQECPNVEIVICTAFSDHGWSDILRELGETDRLQFLRKPFDPVSVQQMALALTKKWLLSEIAEERVSELVAAVDERTRELQEVVHKLAYRNKELQQAKQKADAASAAKSSFVACMSHELRTPLNGVLGATQMLAETELSPDQDVLIDVIQSAGSALRSVIDDVLDSAKIESGHMDLESVPVTIHDVALQACRSCHPGAASKGVQLELIVDHDVPDEFLGDPTRVRQIILNLLSNAVKFTSVGHIVMRVSAVDDNAVATVEDTGIGIEAEALDNIFTAFTQADSSTTRRFGGTGLGLSISRALAENMGGTLDATSQVGKGSCFRLTLPMPDPLQRKRQRLSTKVTLALSCPLRRSALEQHALRMNLNYAMADAANPIDLDGAGLLISDAPDVISSARAEGARVLYVGPANDLPADIPRLASPISEHDLARFLGTLATDNSSPPPVSLEGLRVLIADDAPMNLEIARRMLLPTGCMIELTQDGFGAVSKSEANAFDVILMDCQMPGMDGLEATRRIRARDGNAAPAIIAMTADCTPETQTACAEAGMCAFLSKPVHKIALIDTLACIHRDLQDTSPEEIA